MIQKNQFQQNYNMNENKKISASPIVRKFARELGADIGEIKGSERLGRVTEKDVKNYISNKIKNVRDLNINKSEFDHSDFGKIEIQDIPRIKRVSAPILSNSWNTIPHVTHHDEADITELEEFRNSLKDLYTGENKKMTPLVFIIKSLASALKKFPFFNSSIEDIENGKMTIKKYFHIGIAVDTEHGLMVPKIRNVNEKDLNQLNNELKDISEQCRKLKINKKEFYGGSITISSLGGIGGSFFTPIINYPEVAILGVGKKYFKQVLVNENFKKRIMLPLSLSFDHRIIDGAEAARFCNEIKDNLGKNFAYKLAL